MLFKNLLESWICWIHKHRNHVETASIRVSYSPNVFSIGIHGAAADSVVDACVVVDSDAIYLLMASMFQVYP